MQNTARNMSLGQLMTNEITDKRLLAAMESIPREKCVPAALAGSAYVDEELPLGEGRYQMAPLPFARLLALAEIKPTDNVLDVGCAYGYSTAVIAKLAHSVIGCESDATMSAAALRNIEQFGLANARIAQVKSLARRVPYGCAV